MMFIITCTIVNMISEKSEVHFISLDVVSGHVSRRRGPNRNTLIGWERDRERPDVSKYFSACASHLLPSYFFVPSRLYTCIISRSILIELRHVILCW